MLALIDGTALFFALQKSFKKINYTQLKLCLGITEAHLFTICAEKNGNQQNFLKIIKTVGFIVHEFDIATDFSTRDKRFDTEISYKIGESKEDSLIISDSWGLKWTILEKSKNPTYKIDLAFLSNGLDPRWNKLILNGKVKFIDLEEKKEIFY